VIEAVVDRLGLCEAHINFPVEMRSLCSRRGDCGVATAG
jgi:hypothetical protein